MTSSFKALSILAFALFLNGCTFFETTQGHAVMAYVIEAVVLIATPILLILVKRIVQVIEERTGLSASAQQLELVDSAVYKGIAYAEEQARKALKTDAVAIKGDEKLEMAVDFALKMLKNHDIADMGRDYLTKTVEAHLNLIRTEKKVENAPV